MEKAIMEAEGWRDAFGLSEGETLHLKTAISMQKETNAKKEETVNSGDVFVFEEVAELIFELVCAEVESYGGQKINIVADGLLEILSDGFGFLRSPVSDFAAGADDVLTHRVLPRIGRRLMAAAAPGACAAQDGAPRESRSAGRVAGSGCARACGRRGTRPLSQLVELVFVHVLGR